MRTVRPPCRALQALALLALVLQLLLHPFSHGLTDGHGHVVAQVDTAPAPGIAANHEDDEGHADATPCTWCALLASATVADSDTAAIQPGAFTDRSGLPLAMPGAPGEPAHVRPPPQAPPTA